MAAADNGHGPVLVVDDDPDLLTMVETVLSSAGYQVRTAENGLEALQQVGREMPGIVLLDMKMPVMDGWEFARRFREQFNHRAPLIVVTAAQDARTWAKQVGAEGYLSKPFDLDDLLTCVEDHLPSRCSDAP